MRKISIKLWISLVFISIIATGALSLYMAKHVVIEQQSDGVKINIAGRQRMLTQKMSKDAFLEFYSEGQTQVSKSLTDAMNLFESSNKVLLNGDSVKQITAVRDTDTIEQIKKVESLWTPFSNHLKKIINGDKNLDSLEYIKNSNLTILVETNKVVQKLEAISSDKVARLKTNLTASLLILGALSILAFFVVYNVLFGSINRLTKEITKLAGKTRLGDLSAKVSKDNISKDFNSILWELDELIDSFVMPLTETFRVIEGLSNKKLGERVLGIYFGKFDKLKKDINKAVDIMDGALDQVNNASSLVSTNSDKLSHSSQTLAQGSTEQASTVEEITSSINELNSKTQTNAKDANTAMEDSSKAESNANSGAERMMEMMTAMGQIESSTDEITQIIKTIEDIAFQTNLLALNAAVEAARAGKYGKGFAVVADEVRTLANQASDAAKNTRNIIEMSKNNVSNGVNVAKQVAEQITDIKDKVNAVTSKVSNINSSSNQQAKEMNQINESLTQVTTVVMQNTNIAEESAAMSEELSSQSQELSSLIRKFELFEQRKKRTKVQWSKDFSVTTLRFDNEHKHLFNLIDQVFDAVNRNDKSSLGQLFNLMLEYTEFHFSNEEKLFHKYNYPMRVEHIAEHRKFVDNLYSLKDNLSEKGQLEEEDLSFMTNWLVTHIKGKDTLYHDYIKDSESYLSDVA